MRESCLSSAVPLGMSPMTLDAEGFARAALENMARTHALSTDELVLHAVCYYLGDRRSGRSSYPMPASPLLPRTEPADRVGVDFDLDARTRREFDSECRRQGVEFEQLVGHAVLYLIADLDSGRAAARHLNDCMDAR